MKPRPFQVLSPAEVRQIHAASMDILESVGLRVDLKRARDAFREAGANVDEGARSVRIPAELVQRAIGQAPERFTLYGADPDFRLEIGTDQIHFAGLGVLTSVIDRETGELRPATLEDQRNHLRLVDALPNIVGTPIGVWPTDIPMTTIHAETILAWAQNCRKPFGMGCYGAMASEDMMRMMAIAVGGKEELKRRPRFFGTCSPVSPLHMAQMQLEGVFFFAEYRQPMVMGPEAMAGTTAPATLAGLLAQHNAEVLAHITLAQIIAPGTPVAYGCASTIADMATGNIATGAMESAVITTGAAQLARYYSLPCRALAGSTDARTLDLQCMLERVGTLMPAALAGVHFIVCAGTLDGITVFSEPLLVLDDELCGLILRLARGIEVSEETLALELIKDVGWQGHYLAQLHTAEHYRREHFLPRLLRRDAREAWEAKGSKTALELARERVREILATHKRRQLERAIERELLQYLAMVRQRTMDDYLAAEWAS
jgi:trimethylamine--corrinoid protein Co-methyltransferase